MSRAGLDVKAVRAQFPAFARQVGGEPAVFFDGPAGSQVPRRVIDEVAEVMAHFNANGGGAFASSRESDARIAAAQRTVAAFLNTSDHEAVAFGANMTTLTFGLSRALAKTWKPGDEIVVTRLDHDANVTPWLLAARDAGAVVRTVPFHKGDTTLDLEALNSVLSEKTRLVAVGAAANTTGTVNPIAKISAAAHAVGAAVFVDAVHYAPHRLPDALAWDCDFMACSPYKFFGPHVGILWGKRPLFAELPTYQVGPAGDALPWRWMTGTSNSEGIGGTAAAIEYLASLGEQSGSVREQLVSAFERIRAHEESLLSHLLDGLRDIPAVKVWGITDPERFDERVATVAVTVTGHPSPKVAAYLGERGIFVWSGHFYATTVTADLGLDPEGLVRVGLLHYNTAGEVDRLLAAIAAL